MSDRWSLIPNAVAGGTGASATIVVESLFDLPWWSMLIAAAFAGAVGLVGAANRARKNQADFGARDAWLSIAIGMAAGVAAFLPLNMWDVDGRMAFALVIAAGWAGATVLDGGPVSWLRKMLGGEQ